MPNSTTPELLSDEALRDIEARLQEVYAKWHSPDFVKRLLDTDTPALCQTVRAAWAERDRAMTVLNPSMPENGLEDACRQRMQAYITERDNCDELEKQNAALRDQLAQAQQRILELETDIDTKRGYL